jgi:hypothetical protein
VNEGNAASPDWKSPRTWFLGADGVVRPFWRFLIFVALALLVLQLSSNALRGLLGGQVPPGQVRLLVAYGVFNLVLLLAMWFMLAVFDRRSFRTLGLWFYAGWGRELLVGIGIGTGLLAAVVALLLAGTWLAYLGIASLTSDTPQRIALIGAMLFLAAAFEEILFRGYAFQRLVDSVGPVIAVAVLSGVFGALHLANPGATPLSTANTVLAGILLSAAYLKTRALWLPIGLHWAWNFVMGALLSLPVSGNTFNPPLLHAQPAGPDWMSGGGYGPEGSVVATLLLVPACVWLVRTRRISPSPGVATVLQ